ncbi:hypothetical protein WSM22_33230 [Cytophagales bacterium WSM2-2]|nr:hypothetical protein WSM22_33230 [Cytophagales bacterium WSM2-2]
MNRREFISTTCFTCIGGTSLSALLTSCGSTKYVNGALETSGISIPLSEFVYEQKGKLLSRQFVVVHHDELEFPIYVYKISENSYSALWMKCTHQGSELNASGDHLYCSSHGSEFDKTGKVTHGPAEKSLRSFPVTTTIDKIIIELKK